MNKYIIPTILTFILGTYLTSLITFEVAETIFTEEINKRDDVIGQMEQDISELRFNLSSCEEWCSKESEIDG